jgi:hypothetical protein
MKPDGHVPVQLGSRAARMRGHCGRRGVHLLEFCIQHLREQQIRELGLAVGGHPPVSPVGRQVVEVDVAAPVGWARQHHHAGSADRQQQVEHETGEREVAQMIGAEVGLESIRRLPLGAHITPALLISTSTRDAGTVVPLRRTAPTPATRDRA